MVGDQAQQVGAAGLDLSQISDVVNRQKVSDKRLRNEMMRVGTTDPNAFAVQNQQALQQPSQPTEFLGAGRTSDAPLVTYQGEQLSRIENPKFMELQNKMPEITDPEYAPTYSNDFGKYYSSTNLKSLGDLYKSYDYLNAISAKLPPTITQGKQTGFDWENNTPIYEQISTPAAKLTLKDFYSRYGSTPSGGWSDSNTKWDFVSPELQGWMSDSSLLPTMDLYGKGTPEEIGRGYNILQRMSPQNIGEFWGLAPNVKKGMLQNPATALQQMRATANPANSDWLSIGAEGGLRGISDWNWDANKGLTMAPGSYLDIHGGGGLLGGIFGALDPVLDKLDPFHNTTQNFVTNLGGFDSQEQAFSTIAPMVLNYFVPGAGSALSAADAASTGNWSGAALGALGAYGGFTGTDFGSQVGGAINNATGNAMSSGLANAIGSGVVGTGAGMLAGKDFKASLLGGIGSGLGGYANSSLSAATRGTLGDIGSKILGGAASGGLNSLFNKNSPVAGSLYGGMSGGLHGFLNSTSQNLTPEQNNNNKQSAQAATKLAKLFMKKK